MEVVAGADEDPRRLDAKGGWTYVRSRITDPATGKRKEIKKVLPEADEATAYKWLRDEQRSFDSGSSKRCNRRRASPTTASRYRKGSS
jgi:hypothetical protein